MSQAEQSSASGNPEVAEILASSEVWEMTLPWIPVYWVIETLERYKRSGYTFISLTTQNWPASFDGTVTAVARFKKMAEPHADWLTFGSSLAEIDEGRRAGKLVLGINSQETRIIEADLSRVQALYDLGVRHMLLAYNVRNLVADGCAEAADAGLSNFGRRVVQEMDRVGIIVDGTHTGRRSSLEAIELTQRPGIFSHSGAYKVCAHIRNVHDDQIRACAQSGGVVGVVGIGSFLGDANASTESWFRHIDYIAELVGPQHVGIGTDFVPWMPMKDHEHEFESRAGIVPGDTTWPGSDSTIAWPDPTGTQIPNDVTRCVQPEQLGELVAMMLQHGYSEDVVRGILGENFRRVYATLP